MRLASGNDLASGAVTWWTGAGWSPRLADAAPIGDEAAGEALIAREEAAGRVNAPYLLDAEPDGDRLVPSHIKERMRALGPSVRHDLGPQATEDVGVSL